MINTNIKSTLGLFKEVPKAFFSPLSDPKREIYSECLHAIYKCYEQQIDYRMDYEVMKQIIAQYLFDHHYKYTKDNGDGFKNIDEAAADIIQRFCHPDVQWLRKEMDESTLKDMLVMTGWSISLAQFLPALTSNEETDYTVLMMSIKDVVNGEQYWISDPYKRGLLTMFDRTRQFARALRTLNTTLNDKISKMIAERTLDGVVDNFISFQTDDFMPQYQELRRNNNVYYSRRQVLAQLDARLERYYDIIVRLCQKERDMYDEGDREKVEEHIDNIVYSIKKFFNEDYDDIMRHINMRLNHYWDLCVTRMRYIRNSRGDSQSIVESFAEQLTKDPSFLAMDNDEPLPESLNNMFNVRSHTYLDLKSFYKPRVIRKISTPMEVSDIKPDEDQVAATLARLREEAEGKYGSRRIKDYTKIMMSGRKAVSTKDIDIEKKEDALKALAMLIYAADKDSGYTVQVSDDYVDKNGFMIREANIERKEPENNV